MRREIAPITEADSALVAIKFTLAEGGALLRDCIDMAEFGRVATAYGLDTKGIATPGDGDEEGVKSTVAEVGILAEIDKAMQEAAIPGFNCLTVTPHELGSSLPPHADNTFVTLGITAMMPRNHIGEVSLHGSDHFTVTPFHKTAGGGVIRHTVSREGGSTPFVERIGEYRRGDILLLLQDIPEKGLAAKVHSASSRQRRGDFSSYREVVTLDHFVYFSE